VKKALAVLTLLIGAIPLGLWAVYKPVRVIAPERAANVSCLTGAICIEDRSRDSEALALYDESLRFVESAVGPFREKPRAVFCSSETCFRAFGFNKASAVAVGSLGIVVSPRGWKPYYVRHEMIHHRQAEELGPLYAFVKPRWLIEGMAYALSGDPRPRLAEPWESDRADFSAWYRGVGKEHLWSEAEKL